MNVCCDGVEYSLPLLVVGGKGPALLDRNWLEKIKLNWPIIKQLSSHNKRLEEILQKHAQLFEEGLGTLQGTKAKIHVDPTATPIFHKARPVPYALREKIEQDLGTIEPVQSRQQRESFETPLGSWSRTQGSKVSVHEASFGAPGALR